MPSRNESSSRRKEKSRQGNESVNYAMDISIEDDSESQTDPESDNEEVHAAASASSSESVSSGDDALPQRRSGRGADRDSHEEHRRVSARRTKSTKPMTEPTEADFRDERTRKLTAKSDDDDDDDSESPGLMRKRGTSRRNEPPNDSLARLSSLSPIKSPARHHAQRRLSIQQSTPDQADEAELYSDDSSTSAESEEGQELEPLKIHRILAARTETIAKWKEICSSIQTSEIESGSRWNQASSSSSVDETAVFEERFLIKWKDLSYLHCSWETQSDLENYTQGNAKAHLNTFFRKMTNGILFSADERCDGDYFDPAWAQIDRILDVELPDTDVPALTLENEDAHTHEDYGVILDRSHKEFDDGTGRQFLIKWGNLPYAESTFEFERDLVLCNIEYKDFVKDYIRRTTKPRKSETKARLVDGEKERRRLYKIFGEKSAIDPETKEKSVDEYKAALMKMEYKNGGQLRDYQAEGVTWMVSNYINKRSCILADEMGLGKTLQTATVIDIIIKQISIRGPALIVAPLSTLIHWKREFDTWTDLNSVVYYGYSEDRKLIRENEFAFPEDRPDRIVGLNQLFLKKCGPKRPTKADLPWMFDIVITTPEMVIADDGIELTAVDWECLVVDEAHRLKNHSSKLSVKLRDQKFHFNFKLLLTGTPIQNDISEFWTLLNVIDPDLFDSYEDFADKYGDMKTKERIDELHEEIRPFILRRLKEDVEKSVPPKEETLIEIEMTVMQKQYYRALYESNISFLNKSKKRAIDVPSLNNLAMQLRKCCNHTFLLNGVEDDIRAHQENRTLSEAELLVKGSGKLVLLDKLLPRLKKEGHRVLLFSQFKIMLDILEDYFNSRQMVFERIDGSITGHRRQQAIDRFQAPASEVREPPFIMMLSTRSGGVGITLTAADTVIIFDSDWNPQSDLQAQARCHRIGQTKSVKVYRLVTRKTYEMQMFHMASLKMGLDQAILNGIEVGASGEGALTKDEIERLLRNGAYEIFKEDKEGRCEDESNEFIQQDIDSIMERHSRTVKHDNTGIGGRAKSTFSKASFKVIKSPSSAEKVSIQEDVDVDDPDFWKKVVGESVEVDVHQAPSQRRERVKANTYAESAFTEAIDSAIRASDSDDDDYDEDDGEERCRWGGNAKKLEWLRDDAENVVKLLSNYGYDHRILDKFFVSIEKQAYPRLEVVRMMWSIAFTVFCEHVADSIARGRKRMSETKDGDEDGTGQGGVLAKVTDNTLTQEQESKLNCEVFSKIWEENNGWLRHALQDALEYARSNQPRSSDARIAKSSKPKQDVDDAIASNFAQTWQSLKNRGWKATALTDGGKAGKIKYEYQNKLFWSQEAVIQAAGQLHPDLEQACLRILDLQSRKRGRHSHEDLDLRDDNVTHSKIQSLLERYGCLQLLHDRKKVSKIRLPKRLLKIGFYMGNAINLVQRAGMSSASIDLLSTDSCAIDRLAAALNLDKRSKLPHPLWRPHHDAVLIFAIVKHGWIENEASCRLIAEDSSLPWGAPFVSSRSNVAQSVVSGGVPCEFPSTTNDTPVVVGIPEADNSPELVSTILETAHRAAVFLNENKDLVEMKGVNVDELKDAFCLKYRKETDGQPSKYHWIVDEEALRAFFEAQKSNTNELHDLPPQKDLVLRSKAILTRSACDGTSLESNIASSDKAPETNLSNAPLVLDSLVSGQNSKQDAPASSDSPTPKEKYPFAILDQSLRSNTFLAELLRAILKAPMKNLSRKRTLCSMARTEAARRLDSIRAAMRQGPKRDSEYAKSFSDMERIIRHIDLVKLELTSSKGRLYKNVLRVILGGVPLAGKPGEALFPIEKPTTEKQVLQTFAGSDSRTMVGSKTTGERAFDSAVRRLFVVKRGQENQNSDNVLELTQIETLILRVACSVGLPIWQPDWASQLTTKEGEKRNGYNVKWDQFGELLVQFATEGLKQEEVKRSRVEQMSGSILGNTEQVLFNAQRQYNLKQSACTQAHDYAKDPETLAKKTIMMLPRLQRFARRDPIASAKGDSTLDPRVLKWMETEIRRWSTSLDLVDSAGSPLGFTAKDFLEDLAEEDRGIIEIAACFDRPGCFNILQQVALMCRIRCLFVNRPAQVNRLIKDASAAVTSKKWELEPNWWAEDGAGHRQDSEHDMLLLKRLVHQGFGQVLQDVHGYGVTSVPAAQISFQVLGIGKRAIQVRASMLAKVLHDLDGSVECSSARSDDSSVEVIEAPDLDQKPAAKGSPTKRPVDGSVDSSPPKRLRLS